MNRNVENLRKYSLLDERSENGILTAESGQNIDMKALRKYCKDNKKDYSSLSTSEIEKFLR